MPESAVGAPLRILLVDDDDVFWELVMAILEPYPQVSIERLPDGNVVMPYLQDDELVPSGQWPQLIILDERMPRMDGTELIPLLKGDKETRHLPICLMSTSSQTTLVNKAYDLGASMVMCKAMDFTILRKQVHQLVEFWTSAVQAPFRPATGELF